MASRRGKRRPVRWTNQVGGGAGEYGIDTGFSTIAEFVNDHGTNVAGSPDHNVIAGAFPTVSDYEVGDLSVIEAIAGRTSTNWVRTFPVGNTSGSARTPYLRTKDGYHSCPGLAFDDKGYILTMPGCHDRHLSGGVMTMKWGMFRSIEPYTGQAGWEDISDDFNACHSVYSITYPIMQRNPYDNSIWGSLRDRTMVGSGYIVIWRYHSSTGFQSWTLFLQDTPAPMVAGKAKFGFAPSGRVWVAWAIRGWVYGCDYAHSPSCCYTDDNGSTWRSPAGGLLTLPLDREDLTTNHPSLCAWPPTDPLGVLEATGTINGAQGTTSTYWGSSAFPMVVCTDGLPTFLWHRYTATYGAYDSDAKGYLLSATPNGAEGWGYLPLHWDGAQWVQLTASPSFSTYQPLALAGGHYVVQNGSYSKTHTSGVSDANPNQIVIGLGPLGYRWDQQRHDAAAALQIATLRGFGPTTGGGYRIYYRSTENAWAAHK